MMGEGAIKLAGEGFKVIGSREAVWHGNAKRTKGGLTRADLMKSKGRLISKKKHEAGLKLYSKYKDQFKEHEFKKVK
jgi:hypothetical protein